MGVGGENAPLNVTIVNQLQTNLGIGPLGLLQQYQTHQCTMHSVNELNASANQIALLQAQQVAAQFNQLSLPCHSLLLPNQGNLEQVTLTAWDELDQDDSDTAALEE